MPSSRSLDLTFICLLAGCSLGLFCYTTVKTYMEWNSKGHSQRQTEPSSWEKMLKALGNWNTYRHFTPLTGHTRQDLGCSWSVIIWVLNASPRATSSKFCLQDALGRKSVLEMTESGHWGHDLEGLCISNPFCFLSLLLARRQATLCHHMFLPWYVTTELVQQDPLGRKCSFQNCEVNVLCSCLCNNYSKFSG